MTVERDDHRESAEADAQVDREVAAEWAKVAREGRRAAVRAWLVGLVAYGPATLLVWASVFIVPLIRESGGKNRKGRGMRLGPFASAVVAYLWIQFVERRLRKKGVASCDDDRGELIPVGGGGMRWGCRLTRGMERRKLMKRVAVCSRNSFITHFSLQKYILLSRSSEELFRQWVFHMRTKYDRATGWIPGPRSKVVKEFEGWEHVVAQEDAKARGLLRTHGAPRRKRGWVDEFGAHSARCIVARAL